MQRGTMRRAFWLCLPCLLFSLVLSASARDGNEFAGAYRIGNVSEDGNIVHLTLTVQFFNHSERNIHNGTVALFDNQPRPNPLGGFAPIKLFRSHQQVTLRQQFDVPKAEYERWQSGGQPNVMLLSKDHGMVRMRNIQFSSREPWSGPTER